MGRWILCCHRLPIPPELESTMKNFLLFLRTLNPSMWVMIHAYSAEYDAALLALMEKHRFRDLRSHTVMLGEHELWIANHPYASFKPYVGWNGINVRPSRKTILLAHDRMMKDCFSPTNLQ